MKRIFRGTTAAALLLGLVACTSQQLKEATYHSMQQAQREQCNKLPPGADREQCIKRATAESYEQYKRDSETAKQ